MSKPPGPDTEEQSLFEAAMADVEPIAQDRHRPEITVREPVPVSQREREVLGELDAILSGEAPFELAEAGERLEGAVPGLDRRVLRQLRKGEFTVQADLDLHGVNAETARVLIENFITGCHERGFRCVRIVHGRGRNSPDGVPVLKTNLPRWLARGPARLIVLGYTSAASRDGGTGASYVLLRKHPARRGSPQPL